MPHNLRQLIQSGFSEHVIIQCTASDLNDFASSLIKETRLAVQEQYEPKFYDINELATLLHVKPSAIYAYVQKKILHPVKLTGEKAKLLFDRAEVRKQFFERKIGTHHRDEVAKNIML